MPAHRKSLIQLVAQGTFRSDRHAGRGDGPQSGPLGRCPRDLPTDAAAVWRELAREPIAQHWQKSDRVALEITARLVADARAGVLPPSREPILRLMLDCMGLFGPASRARIAPPEPRPRGRPPGRGKGLSSFLHGDADD